MYTNSIFCWVDAFFPNRIFSSNVVYVNHFHFEIKWIRDCTRLTIHIFIGKFRQNARFKIKFQFGSRRFRWRNLWSRTNRQQENCLWPSNEHLSSMFLFNFVLSLDFNWLICVFIKVQYYIKWKNYPSGHNSWEPVENLSCEQLIEEYEAKHTRRVDSIEWDPKPKTITGSFVANGKVS